MNLFALLPFALALSSLGCLNAAHSTKSPRLQLASLCDVESVMGIKSFLIEIVTMPDEIVASLLNLAETNRAFAKSLAMNYMEEPTMRTCFNPRHTLKDIHLCLLDKQAIEVSLLKILNSLDHHELWMDFAPISTNSGLCLGKFHDSLEAANQSRGLSQENLTSVFDEWKSLRETLTEIPYDEASMGEEAFIFFAEYATKFSHDDDLEVDMVEKIALIAKGACDPHYHEITDLLVEYRDVLHQFRLPYETAVSTFEHFLLLFLAFIMPYLNLEKSLQLIENHAVVARVLPIDGLRECVQIYSTIDDEDDDEDKRSEQQSELADIAYQKIFPVILEHPEALRELLKAQGKQMRLPDDMIESVLDSETAVDFHKLKSQDIAREIEALPELLKKNLAVTNFLIESNWRDLKPVFKYYAGYFPVVSNYVFTNFLPDDPENIPSFLINKMLQSDQVSFLGVFALITAYGRERTLLFRQFLDRYNAPVSGSVESGIDQLYNSNLTKKANLMLPLALGESLPTDEHEMLSFMNRSPIDHGRFLGDLSHIFLISEERDQLKDGHSMSDLEKSIYPILLHKVASYNILRDTRFRGNFSIISSLLVEGVRHAATHPRSVRWMMNNVHVFQGNSLVRDNPSFSLLIKAIVDYGHRLCREKTVHVLENQLLSTTMSHVSGDHLIQALEQTLLSLDDFDKLVITEETSCLVLRTIIQSDPITAVVPWDKVYAKVLEKFPGLERHTIPYSDDILKGYAKLSTFLTLKYLCHFYEFFTVSPADSPAYLEACANGEICGICQGAFTMEPGNHEDISRINCCTKHLHSSCAAQTFASQRACPFCRHQFFPLNGAAGEDDSEESDTE